MFQTFIFIVMSIVSISTLTVKSPAFANNDFIPTKYTCDGENINPALIIKDLPANAKTLALIMDDPDAPKGYVHWLMWNVPASDEIDENTAPGIQGKNSSGENKYAGPCPPRGIHHYHFRVYALDTELKLEKSADKGALLHAMEGHILAQGEIIGVYKRK